MTKYITGSMLILYVAQAAGQTGKLNTKLDKLGTCGQVDRALAMDSRSKGLGFDSHC